MAISYKRDDHIVTITIDRPEAMNAFNMETLQEFSEALKKFRDNDDSWVLIVTGAGGKAFSAGFDLKESIPAEFPPLITRGLEIWKPIIAAVNGIALGGGLEVALACDFRIASENATFGVPEVRWGLMPGWGATQRLPRVIPLTKAAEMLLMARIVDAQEAYNMGLVNKVVQSNKLISVAKQWAVQICELGPLAVRAAKECLINALSSTIEDGLRIEKELFTTIKCTEDAEEGPRAFAEKRKPVFKGR